MRTASVLELTEGFPVVSFETLVRCGVLVIAPHPDDESLGCGGLIATARQRNVPVRIVIVSDGVGSHPNSSTHPPRLLQCLREEEAIAAAGELGVSESEVKFLRLPDRYIPSSGPKAEAAIVEIVRAAQGADFMAVTWQHDPHCDHQAAFALARTATKQLANVRLYTYPIWAFKLTPAKALELGFRRGIRVSIADQLPTKRRAIAAHRSQVTRMINDDPNGFVLEGDDLAPFDRPYETYQRVIG
jgi:LmbE family N-acetylglucosaminyl deacetylase